MVFPKLAADGIEETGYDEAYYKGGYARNPEKAR
jgi:hypothetical protein